MNKIFFILLFLAVIASFGAAFFAGRGNGGKNSQSEIPKPPESPAGIQNQGSVSVDLERPPFLDE
jgi:hypothetical protein